MKLETILNAMVMADRRRIVPSYLQGTFPNAQRQYHAFRDRILQMDADKEYKIALLVEDKWNLIDETRQLKQRIGGNH